MLRKQKKLTKKELKKDPLVLFAARALDTLKEYGTRIAIGFAAVILVTGLAYLIITTHRRNVETAFGNAITALYSNSPEALGLLRRVSDKYGSTPRGKESLILLGNQYFYLEDHEAAEECFNKYIRKHSDDPVYSLNAHTALASIYEDRGEHKKAGETYSRFVQKNKSSSFAPYMLLKAAKAYYKADEHNLARRNVQQIIQRFPESREFAEAKSFADILN